jgi:hypothetical protein
LVLEKFAITTPDQLSAPSSPPRETKHADLIEQCKLHAEMNGKRVGPPVKATPRSEESRTDEISMTEGSKSVLRIFYFTKAHRGEAAESEAGAASDGGPMAAGADFDSVLSLLGGCF